MQIPQPHLIDIPEGTMGEYAIRHVIREPNYEFDLNTMRTAIFGQKGGKVSWPFETRWHELTENEGVWMTDLPIEQKQMWDNAYGLKGHVLVGGLGLGVIATMLARRRSITKITIVEISEEVIELVGPYILKDTPLRSKIAIEHADLFDFLKAAPTNKPFDTAFYDIWQPDNEATFHHTVVPLLNLSTGKVTRRPLCWNEDVMRGQKVYGLSGRCAFLLHPELGADGLPPLDKLCEWDKGNHSIWVNWSVPFYRWVKEASPDEKTLQEGIRFYASNWGDPGFETNWCLYAKLSFEVLYRELDVEDGSDVVHGGCVTPLTLDALRRAKGVVKTMRAAKSRKSTASRS